VAKSTGIADCQTPFGPPAVNQSAGRRRASRCGGDTQAHSPLEEAFADGRHRNLKALMNSRVPISWLVRPLATRRKISTS
jgi:hypothetical protein